MAIEREVSFSFDRSEYSWFASFADFDTEESVFVREFSVQVPDSRFAETKALVVDLEMNTAGFSDAVFEQDWPEWLDFLYRSTVAQDDVPPRLFPEPVGCTAAKDFLKENPKNNDFLVWTWRDDPWGDIVREMNEQITLLVPTYNLSQVRQKFARFDVRYQLNGTYSEAIQEQVRWVIAKATYDASQIPRGTQADARVGV